jgi:hypothetical protein
VYGIPAVHYFETRPHAAYDLNATSSSKQILHLLVTAFIYSRNRQIVLKKMSHCGHELLILQDKLPRACPLRFLKGRKADTRTVYEEVDFTLQLLLLPGGSSPARG